MDAELAAVVKVCSTAMLALSYCYFIASKLPSGKFRLFSVLPVLYLFTQLPFLFTSVHLRGISAFYLVWLSTFKLLLFSFSQGPLSIPDLSFPLFLTVSSLPIKLDVDGDDEWERRSVKVLIYSLKGFALSFVTSMYPQRHEYHRLLVLGLYSIHTYLSIDLILGLTSLLSFPILVRKKIRFEPQFSAPYLSTSLQDFWGRRWNLMVTRLLHPTVYVPVKAYFGHYAGSVSAFVVSGVMHEVMFYYITSMRPTGEVMCFFVLHGVCTAVEIGVKTVLGRQRGWRPLPRVVAAPMTVMFVFATAQWLFFPPLLRGNVEERVISECTLVVEAAKKVVGIFNFFPPQRPEV